MNGVHVNRSVARFPHPLLPPVACPSIVCLGAPLAAPWRMLIFCDPLGMKRDVASICFNVTGQPQCTRRPQDPIFNPSPSCFPPFRLTTHHILLWNYGGCELSRLNTHEVGLYKPGSADLNLQLAWGDRRTPVGPRILSTSSRTSPNSIHEVFAMVSK